MDAPKAERRCLSVHMYDDLKSSTITEPHDEARNTSNATGHPQRQKIRWTSQTFHHRNSSTEEISGDEYIGIKYSDLTTSPSAPMDPRRASSRVAHKPLLDGVSKAVVAAFASRCSGNVRHCAHLSEEEQDILRNTLRLFLNEIDSARPAQTRNASCASSVKAHKVGNISFVASFERCGNSEPVDGDSDYTGTPLGTVVAKCWPGVSVKDCPDQNGFWRQRMTTMGGRALTAQRMKQDPNARDSISMVRYDPNDDGSLASQGQIRIVDDKLNDPSKWQNSTLTPILEFVKYDTLSLLDTHARIHPEDIVQMCQVKMNSASRYCHDLADAYGKAVAPGHIKVDLAPSKRLREEDDAYDNPNHPTKNRGDMIQVRKEQLHDHGHADGSFPAADDGKGEFMPPQRYDHAAPRETLTSPIAPRDEELSESDAGQTAQAAVASPHRYDTANGPYKTENLKSSTSRSRSGLISFGAPTYSQPGSRVPLELFPHLHPSAPRRESSARNTARDTAQQHHSASTIASRDKQKCNNSYRGRLGRRGRRNGNGGR
jgi:hypothetical protein